MNKEVIQILVLCLFLGACNGSFNGEKISGKDRLSVIDELTGENKILSQVKFDQDFVRGGTTISLSQSGMEAKIRFLDRQIELLGKIAPKEFLHLQNALGSNQVITYDPIQRVIIIKGNTIPTNLAEVSDFFLYKDLQSIQQKRLKEFETRNHLISNKQFEELTIEDRFNRF